MLCTDDGFVRPRLPRLQHAQGVTICDYLAAYDSLKIAKVFPDVPNVRWEDKLFDVTVGYDILDNRRTTAEFLEEGGSTLSCVIVSSLEYILFKTDPKNKRAKKYLKDILNKEGKTRIAVLAAHGETAYGSWHYYESDVPVAPVQEWIDEQSRNVQGKQRPDVLIIGCCNPASFVPAVKGVPVLYATGVVGIFKDYTYHLKQK